MATEVAGRLRRMVPSAYLRVFQPLEAFRSEEQAEWERFIVGGGRPRPVRPLYRQRVMTGRLGLLAPAEGERAEFRVMEGAYYVCPSRTRLRILASLLSFREVQPLELSDHFVPENEARKAQRELNRLRRREPGAVSFLMQSPWHVPVRWFVLVDDDERRLIQREDGDYRLFYLTTARKAVRRAERAVPALRKSDLGPVAGMITELVEWLAQFDDRSLVELDYDRLTDLMTWDELDDDHSARDINEALAALSQGEFPRSAQLYQSVLGRWAEVRNREVFN